MATTIATMKVQRRGPGPLKRIGQKSPACHMFLAQTTAFSAAGLGLRDLVGFRFSAGLLPPLWSKKNPPI